MKERIKQIRKSMRLTQEQLGYELHYSAGHIGDLEAGRKTITDRTIQTICERFNVSETWLRTGDGEMFVPPTPPEPTPQSDREALIRMTLKLFDALSPEGKEAALRYAHEVTDKMERKLGEKTSDKGD